jgi:hypothetical protein
MKATNEQIIAEANRRWGATPSADMTTIEDFIIEVTRENWTPPEPVDSDWELAKTIARGRHSQLADVSAVAATAASVLAGIKAGREQERERAKVLVEYMMVAAAYDKHARITLAKYRGEA